MCGGGKTWKKPGISPFYGRMLQFSWDELDYLDIWGMWDNSSQIPDF